MQLRQGVEAEFALTNSLGIRADFESGPLNLEEMYNVFPFDNTITTMYLSGDETQQMLDFVAARSAERGCRTQAQVSGIYFDAICADDDTDCNTRLGAPGAVRQEHLPRRQLPHARRHLQRHARASRSIRSASIASRSTTTSPTAARASRCSSATPPSSTPASRCATRSSTTSARCPTAAPTRRMYTNVVGVNCKDAQGETYDCTAKCSGDAAFASCTAAGHDAVEVRLHRASPASGPTCRRTTGASRCSPRREN